MDKVKNILKHFSTIPDLNSAHICLFMAIYGIWQQMNFTNSIFVSRSQLMRLSKIKSTATYHRCIKDFIKFGFIEYQPSFHPTKGTTIILSTHLIAKN